MMHRLLAKNAITARPHPPGRACESTKAARPFLRDQSGKTRLTAMASSRQQSQRRQTVCYDAAPNNGRGLSMLRRALQLAEPQLAEPNSVISLPSDISRPCLGRFAAARAARNVSRKIEDTMTACSNGGVPSIVQQSLQSSLHQQQLLMDWLESEVQQEAPCSPSSEAVTASCTADAAASQASEETNSTAADCTVARSAPTAASSASSASSQTNSMSRPGSVASHNEVPHAKSLAEGFLGSLEAPTSSVDDHVQEPTAIWAGVAATRGQKKSMEDCHALHYLHPELGAQHIDQCTSDTSSSTFVGGVYDGHGGRSTAAYAAAELPRVLQQELLNSSRQGAVSQQQLFTGVFHQVDRSWKNHGHFEKSGSTAVTALINRNNLVVANAGDSVAVLARGGSSRRLTESHKLSDAAELERISALGGIPVRDRAGNLRLMQSPLRIQPYVAPITLAVTRGFGDFGFKGLGGDLVIPTPYIQELELTADDKLLLLTSDGVTDVMDDDSMMEVAINAITKAGEQTNEGSQLSLAAAAAVKDAALAANAWDNITVVAVLLEWSKYSR